MNRLFVFLNHFKHTGHRPSHLLDRHQDPPDEFLSSHHTRWFFREIKQIYLNTYPIFSQMIRSSLIFLYLYCSFGFASRHACFWLLWSFLAHLSRSLNLRGFYYGFIPILLRRFDLKGSRLCPFHETGFFWTHLHKLSHRSRWMIPIPLSSHFQSFLDRFHCEF